MLVMGSPVEGGQVYGQYPSLTVGRQNPLDVGNGVLIPTTPLNQVYAELALWFGVDNQDILRLFPNLDNFRQQGKLPLPLGLLKETEQATFV